MIADDLIHVASLRLEGNEQDTRAFILQSLDQDELEPAQFIQENIADNLLDVERELRQPLDKGDPTQEQFLEELVRTVMRLRRERMTDSLNQLRFLQEDLQQDGEMGFGAYQELVLQFTQTRDRLDRALKGHLV